MESSWEYLLEEVEQSCISDIVFDSSFLLQRARIFVLTRITE